MWFEIRGGRLILFGARDEQVIRGKRTVPATKAITHAALEAHERVAKSIDRRHASASFPEDRGSKIMSWLSSLGFNLSPADGLHAWHTENVSFRRRKKGHRINRQP